MDHIPVMPEEAIEALDIQAGGVYWDGTFGRGGHSARILAALGENGALYASDRDSEAAGAAAAWSGDPRFHFSSATLEASLAAVPDELSGFLWDLGCSTPQLKDGSRGFSFREHGPLDMRMDRKQSLTAAELVNTLAEEPLANLIYRYGEERYSRRIATRIVERRRLSPIEDTQTLADICRASYPRHNRRIDPATRTFQALRIAVNDELGQVERALPQALRKLGYGGRAVVISFHSLEDRIVKHCFRDHARTAGFRLIVKKPLTPGAAEADRNPAARSAKMRVLSREESS